MKVWVIHSTGPLGPQLVAVVPTLSQAVSMMVDDTCTGVEIEVGQDYTNVHKFVIVTKQNPKPRMIDFGAVAGVKPIVLSA